MAKNEAQLEKENLVAIATEFNWDNIYLGDMMETYCFIIDAAETFSEHAERIICGFDSEVEWVEAIAEYARNLEVYVDAYQEYPDARHMRQVIDEIKCRR